MDITRISFIDQDTGKHANKLDWDIYGYHWYLFIWSKYGYGIC